MHSITPPQQHLRFSQATTVKSRCGGFSLVEILVVIAVMASMLALAGSAFRSGIGAASPLEASNLVSATILSARSQAMTLRSGSRIVVDASFDAGNPDRHLRRISIERKESTASGTEWVDAGKTLILPKNTFFSTDYSSGYDTETDSGDDLKYIYEFDEAGRLVTSGSGDARVVFVAGIMDEAGQLQTPDAMLPRRNGFIIRKAGRVTFFDHPDQITLTTP